MRIEAFLFSSVVLLGCASAPNERPPADDGFERVDASRKGDGGASESQPDAQGLRRDSSTTATDSGGGGEPSIAWEELLGALEGFYSVVCLCVLESEDPHAMAECESRANVACERAGFQASVAQDADYWRCRIDHLNNAAVCATEADCAEVAHMCEVEACTWNDSEAQAASEAAYDAACEN